MKPLKPLLMVVLAFFCVKAPADEVDATAAQAVAENFLQSSAARQFRSRGPVSLDLAHAEPSAVLDGAQDYYVFNTSDGSAFVIVAGDDRASDQVLAYGNGAMDFTALPCNVRWMLDQYKRQIEFLQSRPDGDGPKPLRAQSRTASAIEPLLTSMWNQTAPYYDQCPIYEGSRCVTGCVATALAQVMYYWKHPAVLPALSSFTTSTLQFVVPALPGTTLDWDNMLDKYKQPRPGAEVNFTPEQGAAVATLMRYCGQACYMDYTPDASGAAIDDQRAALLSFGYSEDAVEIFRDNYSDEEWNAMLLEDLGAGRPVLYTGSSRYSGHAFVLDGYADGKYHVNWGWGGTSDGYFTLDMLGSVEYGFNYYQEMVYNVYPREDGMAAVVCDFQEDGIYYKKCGAEVMVVNKDNLFNSYQGVVDIPSTVTHGGETYEVTAIGDNAFRNCHNLTNVVIAGTVKRIGFDAFRNCDSLVEITIGQAVDSIGYGAFRGCSALKKVEIEDMAAFARLNFDDVYSSPLSNDAEIYHQGEPVTELVIPGSAGRIGKYAFTFSSCITSVTIGEGVTSIGDYAFYECPALARVELPNSLESIGLCGFAFGENITDITIGEGLKTVVASAFYGCTSLKSLTLPSTLESIGYASFAYCSGIERVEFKGGDISLGDAVFYACTSMAELILSPEQTTLGDSSFGCCNSLQHVDMGQHLDSIAPYAFYSCTSLGSLTIPATVRVMDEGAFNGCTGLTQVAISDLDIWCAIEFKDETANPLYYAHTLLVGGEAVKDLELSSDIQTICGYAFVRCTSLESVSIPASLTSIGESAFMGCSGLMRVNVPDLETWCAIDFKDEAANPLNSGKHLFAGNEEVNHLVIPETVNAIARYAFSGYEGLTDVTTGNHVTAIGNRAFNGCKNLVSVTVGDGVTSIGERAFASCGSLKTVTLGRGIETIATKAFTQSMSIADITCKAPAPPALGAKDCFSLIVYKSATVRVPSASLEDYSGAAYWDQFKHLNGVNFDALKGDVNCDGEVNIADINAVIEHIVNGDEIAVADVNGDGEVNVADINAVIDVIINAK